MNLTDAAHKARRLMQEHGLTGWTFSFDRSVRRFGVCKHGTREIGLSQRLTQMNDEATVTDVILHEIAHALVGSGHGHDHVWKRKCREIGANPQRCYESDKVETPDAPYEARCKCTVHKMFRRPKPGARRCRKCGQSVTFYARGTAQHRMFVLNDTQGVLADALASEAAATATPSTIRPEPTSGGIESWRAQDEAYKAIAARREARAAARKNR